MQVTVCGLRGGVGTTSIAVMLADALSLLGESVLLIDLNSSDLLRLHFNIPYADTHGWAFAQGDGGDWQQQVYRVKENLHVLPYGRNGLASLMGGVNSSLNGQVHWCEHDLLRSVNCSWVVFDVPNTSEQYTDLCENSDLNLLVTQADMASHILLGQYSLSKHSKIVVNQLNVKQRLSDAVLLDWNIRYAEHLVPVNVRQDLHVQEAFAHKMPATTYFPSSSSARDILSLATWCLVKRGTPK